MARILRNLPFFEDQRTVRIPEGPVVTLKHHQIMVWVSLTPSELATPPTPLPRFPAILDTGFNDTFLMQEAHLRSWAGLAPDDVTVLDFITVSGRELPLLDADVWIHPNSPGHRDQISRGVPFRLELSTGIGLTPFSMSTPRLPLLGMLALRRAKLHLHVDFESCHISLHSPRRFWILG